MLEEHGKISNLLDIFKEEVPRNFDAAKELFSNFKWNLEKHFLVEEQAIFDVVGSLVGEEISDIFDLMQEHGNLLEIVKNIEEGLESNVAPDASGLADALVKHAEFENETFYPKLDELLNENQKKEITEKAEEMLKG